MALNKKGKKIIKNKLKLFCLLGLNIPILVNASGMGIYTLNTLNIQHDGTYTNNSGNDIDYDLKEDKTIGLGLVFDSNIGKNKVYNYRLGLEYLQPKMKSGYEWDKKISTIHTFGFGVFRNKRVRVWIGPRINLGYEERSKYESGWELGIAPSAGINVHLGSAVSLGLDLDYKFAIAVGSSDYNDDYVEAQTGSTARLYLLFKFGEKFH